MTCDSYFLMCGVKRASDTLKYSQVSQEAFVYVYAIASDTYHFGNQTWNIENISKLMLDSDKPIHYMLTCLKT